MTRSWGNVFLKYDDEFVHNIFGISIPRKKVFGNICFPKQLQFYFKNFLLGSGIIEKLAQKLSPW